MNTRECRALIKKITDLPAKSNSFFEIYKAVSSKYWDFNDPDDEIKARTVVHMYAERGDPAEVQITAKVASELIKMNTEKKQACKMKFEFDNLSFTVDIYQDGIARDQLDELINHAAKIAKEKGFTLKPVENKDESPKSI